MPPFGFAGAVFVLIVGTQHDWQLAEDRLEDEDDDEDREDVEQSPPPPAVHV